MFVLGGLGALVVWHLRKALPESPRWLESVDRCEEADVILRAIEQEVSLHNAPLKPPLISSPAIQSRGLRLLLSPLLLPRMIVGATTLIVVNTLIFGFITWLPTFFVQAGRSIASSLGNSLVMSLGAPLGSAIGASTADSWGRKPTILGASLLTIVIGSIYPFVSNPRVLLGVGFLLTIPIYILVTLLFAIYIPELFPTEIRMRASGICNTFGRGATILTPFIVVALFRSYNVGGVLAFMIALLIVQIVVVLMFGVEPKKRGLEEIESEGSIAPHPAKG
jgi:putative MFS transporter